MNRCTQISKETQSILNSQKGFSLVEILVALTLIGVAGTFVVGKIFDQLKEGQIQSTKIQMTQFQARLQEYRRKCNVYPSSEQGLEALIQKPTSGKECKNYPPEGFIDGESVPNDPWDEPYVYESDGRKFNMISYGPDTEEGTEDDISFRDKKKGDK
jgi:general secretion pathway protein G